MAKDPAFLFYPGDWLGGTLGMTFEEKGAYIELLMLQFNRGHMTKEMILQTLGHMGGQLFGRIEDKFRMDSDGMYYNERLEIEIKKRQAYIKSRCNNVSGVNQHTKNSGHMDAHTSSHMEDENEDIKKEGYGEKEKINSNGYITPNYFEKFWAVYPRKVDKGKALTKWNSLCTKGNKRPKWVEIKKAILSQMKSERWQTGKFIPHPATWLNQSRWLDDPNEMKNFDREETPKCPRRFVFGQDYEKYAGCAKCEDNTPKIHDACGITYRNQN